MGQNLTKIKPVQGHIDTGFDDERWMGSARGSGRFTMWFMGDDPDGPVVLCGTTPPSPDGKEVEIGPAHSHACDSIRIIVEGSFKLGEKWYRAGEMRIQEAGRIYGPEVCGPDGCKQVIIFEKRSGVLADYVKATDKVAKAGTLDFFNELMAQFTPQADAT